MTWYYSRKSKRNFAKTLSQLFKSLLFVMGCLSIGAILVLIHKSYQDYVNPQHVYGRWLEIGAPSYDSASLEFTEQGVFHNQRMVSTQFNFNGSVIKVKTGSGVYIYQLTRMNDIPHISRIQPNSPSQRFVKKGYEHLIDMENGGIAKKRRVALAEHFSEK